MPFEPRIIADDDPRDGAGHSRLQAEACGAAPRANGQNSGEIGPVQPQPVWDDAEALGLSGDLALLAEQLVEDANFLARRHPADATPAQRAAAVAGGGLELARHQAGAIARRQAGIPALRRAGWAAAAAAVLAVAGLAWLAWNVHPSDHRGEARTGGAATGPLAASPARPHPAPPAIVSNQSSTDSAAEPGPRIRTLRSEPLPEEPVANPAEFLRGVSGPELDGMLDLLEPEESGLSI